MLHAVPHPLIHEFDSEINMGTYAWIKSLRNFTFKAKNPYYFGLLIMSLIVTPILFYAIFVLYLQPSYGQLDVDNWQTYVDPDKKFTLFYPPGWITKGKENFLSSIDLTLTNPNATKPFQITITYIMNDSSLNYTGNEIIVPANNLRNLEGQLKGAYQ